MIEINERLYDYVKTKRGYSIYRTSTCIPWFEPIYKIQYCVIDKGFNVVNLGDETTGDIIYTDRLESLEETIIYLAENGYRLDNKGGLIYEQTN